MKTGPYTAASSYVTMSPTWPSLPHFRHQFPPPASSIYSNNNNNNYNNNNTGSNNQQSRSAALRPLSFFQRLTPRLGQQRTGDVEAGYSGDLYEASAVRRSTASTHLPENPFADPVHQPEPLGIPDGQHNQTLQRPEAMRLPDRDHDIPIAFVPDEMTRPFQNPGNRRAKRPRGHTRRRGQPRYPPGFKPRSALKDPDVKVKVMHVTISGLLFVITLIVFLALQPTTPVFSPPFRIINSLLIVFFAVIFIHSCIRLNTMLRAFRRKQRRIARKNAKADGLIAGSFDSTTHQATGSGDYGRTTRAPYFDDPEIGLPPPGEPFRVVLARDEELGLTGDLPRDDAVAEDDHRPTSNAAAAAAAGEMQDDIHDRSTATAAAAAATNGNKPADTTAASVKPPPPTYGVWRGSVRADPNLLHWQRVPGPVSLDAGDTDEMQARPPPSYRTEEVDRRRAHEAGYEGMQTLPSTRYLV